MEKNTMKKWTIMVYMCGDNNLSIDMAYALQDIREVAKTTGGEINILAYYDSHLPDVPTYYFDFSDYNSQTQVLSVDVKNKFHPMKEGLDNPANENAAYAYSVLNFVDWCVNKVEYEGEDGKAACGRQAENYALIFSGHSFGFQDIGLFKDESADYSMKHSKLKWAFDRLTKPEGSQEPGESIILGKKLGILGFDSCVMSMLEVGYQFHKYAETMVASEGSVPNAGWTYGKLLGNICRKTEATDTHATARNLVYQFIKTESEFAIGGVSVDMAAWDCTKVPDVTDAFEKVADLLLTCFTEEKSVICRQMRRILLQVHWNCQSYMYEQNIDLKDFCKLLYEEVESLEQEFGSDFDGLTKKLKDACFNVMQKLEECILLSGFCGGQYQFSNGMSLFFPWTLPSYQVSQSCYESLAFHTKTGAGEKWNRFLQFYLTVVTIRHPPNVAPEDQIGALGEDSLAKLSAPQIFEYTARLPQNTASKLPQNTASKLPPNTASKSPANADLKILGNGNGHGSENEVGKLPQNIASKIPQNIASKFPWDPSIKLPQNTASKLPQNTASKLPQNTASKMFGGMDSFFHYFMSMKNVVTPWNVYGFTKKIDDEVYGEQAYGKRE
jgi:hypothetical protein